MTRDIGRTAVVAVLIATACIASAGDELDIFGPAAADGTVFLSLPEPPTLTMEALFEGRVRVDSRGCLRLDGPDPATVVWPYGARLDGSTVRDGAGRPIGALGARFRLGGGEVPALPAGIVTGGLTRDEVAARCPGRFWIVGEVY